MFVAEGQSASIQGLRDPLPGPVVDELARRIDPALGWTLLEGSKTGTLSEQPGVREHPRRLLGQVNSDADLDPTKPQPDQQEDDGERHQDLLRLAGRGPSLTGKPTVKPSLSFINTDSPLKEGQNASIQGLRDPLPGPVVDELARQIDPAPGWTQRPNGIWLLTIHGWTLAAVPGHADWDSRAFWTVHPPWPIKREGYGASGYAPDLDAAKRQALLHLRNQFDLGGTDTSLKDLFERLLGGGLLPEDDNLGEFVDPAIKPRDLAHPNDADDLLDLPNILFKPGLPSLQAADVSLQPGNVGLQAGNVSLQLGNVSLETRNVGLQAADIGVDGVHLGQQLQQQGLQVIHGGVSSVAPPSYTAPLSPSTLAISTGKGVDCA